MRLVFAQFKASGSTARTEKVEATGAVQKIREYIHKKDSSLEITPSMINTHRMKLFKDGELTKAENKEAYNWFKNQEKEVAV